MKFGAHQSFYLRVNWLSKAIKMQDENPRFFFDDFAFEKIGLGRNMVKSLRYWIVATNVMEEGKDDNRQSIHQLTEFGKLVAVFDRFMRLPLTSVVLHYMLATNKEHATTWYWFFNEYNHRSSNNEDIHGALSEWVTQHHKRPVSANTLKRDLDCLKQMYTARAKIDNDPEEVVASPLSGIELIYDSREQFIKNSPGLERLDMDGLYFGLLHYCYIHQVDSVTLEEIQIKPQLWGKLFHLSSNQILEVLELFHADPSYPVSFVRTNQIYSLNLEVVDPYIFLQKAYERKAAY
ncbi:DUF4007 family protein [Paenibacillus radicis (ex Gao et al. 2016)]|uniref:DUF4007 domain-containing protein n=1 Tax=Paenibacillus radicis (ex Gao et al. 2016) TaxID=1737354 RepID=A0A917M086_9BACL|nr:DUF4007 family protein [Paenibacillus radicis (ex Gao et al. 2016)]GGG67388.1 hypothetical protein GCM10010918_22510 [Paenibacillus radicis (ex Gao et al. 2016)]